MPKALFNFLIIIDNFSATSSLIILAPDDIGINSPMALSLIEVNPLSLILYESISASSSMLYGNGLLIVGSFFNKNLLKINNFSNDKSENGIN